MKPATTEFLLSVESLSKKFSLDPGLFSRDDTVLKAIDEVSLQIERGKVYGLVGESGSGKSTLARSILQLIKADSGKVVFRGIDLCTASAEELKGARKALQLIFQDSSAALSPRRTILQSLVEPLEQFRKDERSRHRSLCDQVLDTVGLDPSVLHRLPHQLSSGQRQRIGIARAILTEPELIIADEAVSALDVSVQAQILELIENLRSEHGIAFLLISHDLAVISQVADVVGVMFQGQIVETAPANSLFRNAAHPYTRELMAAIPNPDPSVQMSTIHLNKGLSRAEQNPACVFSDRCVNVMSQCKVQVPVFHSMEPAGRHLVKCHLFTKDAEETSRNSFRPENEI